MRPRQATLADTDDIAALHVQCWHETYVGLLPATEIAKRDAVYRRNLWSKMIAANDTTIHYLDGIGFAQMGPQRDETLTQDYPRELYSFYVLKASHGSGVAQALLANVLAMGEDGFSALVLKGNARAIGFYRKAGGTYLKQVIDTSGYVDLAFGWKVPIQLHR